jgi:hypothetical protein
MVLNQKGKMEASKILQHVQNNTTMVKENVNPSCVFPIDVNEPHFFVQVLNDEDSQHWKKATDFEFKCLQNNKIWKCAHFPTSHK